MGRGRNAARRRRHAPAAGGIATDPREYETPGLGAGRFVFAAMAPGLAQRNPGGRTRGRGVYPRAREARPGGSARATIEMDYLRLSACREGGNPFEKILIPARLRALILSAPGSLSRRHLEWRCDKKRGRRPTMAPRMERREAQPRTQPGARALARRARPPDRKGGLKGPRKPLAPPGAPFPVWGNGKREAAYPGPSKEHGR